MLPYTCIPVSIACYRHEPMQYITGIIDLFFEGPFFVFFMHAFMHDDDMVVLVSAVAANFFDNGIHSFIHSFLYRHHSLSCCWHVGIHTGVDRYSYIPPARVPGVQYSRRKASSSNNGPSPFAQNVAPFAPAPPPPPPPSSQAKGGKLISDAQYPHLGTTSAAGGGPSPNRHSCHQCATLLSAVFPSCLWRLYLLLPSRGWSTTDRPCCFDRNFTFFVLFRAVLFPRTFHLPRAESCGKSELASWPCCCCDFSR